MATAKPLQHDDANGIAERFVELATSYECTVENENGKKIPIAGALRNNRFTRALVMNAIGLLGMIGNRQQSGEPEQTGMSRFTSPVLLALDLSVEVASRNNATISLTALEESAKRIRKHLPKDQAPDNIAQAISSHATKVSTPPYPDTKDPH